MIKDSFTKKRSLKNFKHTKKASKYISVIGKTTRKNKQSAIVGDFKNGARYIHPFTSHSNLIWHIRAVEHLQRNV